MSPNKITIHPLPEDIEKINFLKAELGLKDTTELIRFVITDKCVRLKQLEERQNNRKVILQQIEQIKHQYPVLYNIIVKSRLQELFLS